MMQVATTIAREFELVDQESINVSKDILDLFMSGMYVSPLSIYREYTQNAADSIDEARNQGLLSATRNGAIEVEIDHGSRSAIIRDNGAGIKLEDAAPRLLAIGGSKKLETRARGFRGIGRLAGLAYCRTVEFRTKASGEDIMTSVTWDCQGLRQRLSDRNFTGDIRRLISEAVHIDHQDAKRYRQQHFFEVHLGGIVRLPHDALLNEKLISEYLAQVAPLRFEPCFSFAEIIEKQLALHGVPTLINLTVAGKPIYRPYHNEIALPGKKGTLRLEDVEFFEFADVDGEAGAIGWIAHHQYSQSIPQNIGIRGLRARIGNLQVGEESIFADCFKEPRFNTWVAGEVHITDRRIIPNARRDNFVTNHHFYNLLTQVCALAGKLSQRCRKASISRNSIQSACNLIRSIETGISQEHLDHAESSHLNSLLARARLRIPQISEEAARRNLTLELDRLEVELSKKTPSCALSLEQLESLTEIVSRTVTNRKQAIKLFEQLRLLCAKPDSRLLRDKE